MLRESQAGIRCSGCLAAWLTFPLLLVPLPLLPPLLLLPQVDACVKLALKARDDGHAVVIGLQSSGESSLMQVGWFSVIMTPCTSITAAIKSNQKAANRPSRLWGRRQGRTWA